MTQVGTSLPAPSQLAVARGSAPITHLWQKLKTGSTKAVSLKGEVAGEAPLGAVGLQKLEGKADQNGGHLI